MKLCEWDESTNKCQNASPTTLTNKNFESCYLETGGTYHWSNS